MQMIRSFQHEQLLLWWIHARLHGILIAILHLFFDLNKLVKVEGSFYKGRKVLRNYLILRLLNDKLGCIHFREYGPDPSIESKNCLNALFPKRRVDCTHATERVSTDYQFVQVHTGV
jgi:hypothetical protein